MRNQLELKGTMHEWILSILHQPLRPSDHPTWQPQHSVLWTQGVCSTGRRWLSACKVHKLARV